MAEKREKAHGISSSPMPMMGSRVLESGEEVNTTMRTAETLLRLLPMALCLSALVVMLKNSQSNDYGSLSYSDLGAFRYLVHANGICAGYSLLSAIVAIRPRPFTMPHAWTFFCLDQVLTYVVLVAGAVSAEALYLANKGDMAVTWSAACGSFGSFCNKATISIVISFVVVLLYAVLSLISSYRLFSRYEAPVDYPGKAIEATVFHS
ncbi:hypothetical protein ACFE04_022785 [Oxalis oulophora]